MSAITKNSPHYRFVLNLEQKKESTAAIPEFLFIIILLFYLLEAKRKIRNTAMKIEGAKIVSVLK